MTHHATAHRVNSAAEIVPEDSFVVIRPKDKSNRLTAEQPASLIAELSQKVEAPLSLKEMSNLCYLIMNKELFVVTMTNFLGLVKQSNGVDFTFSTFASKGVLRLTGISNVASMKEEQVCLSSMMKLFGGFVLSDNASITLVFQMKSMFNWD